MTHLPECYKEGSTDSCICDELRACEQRVLDAAREALDALPTEQTVKEGVSEFWVEINHAIAAIDALREETK